MSKWLSMAGLSLTLAGCLRGQVTEPPELDDGEHLLLTPRGDPEKLLGRTVTQDAAGGLVISDERPPGCQVKVTRVPQRWRRTYGQDIGHVAHIGTGKTPIGDLTAKYGKSMRVDAEIDNLESLEADLRGCSGTVVKSVRVGTGKREIRVKEEARGRARVKTKVGPVGAGGGKWRNIDRSLEWTDPQAWSFSVVERDASTALKVDLILMPEQVHDGQTFSVRILAARQVYLVVGYVNEDGRAGLLLPGSTQPVPMITAGGNVELTLRAELPTPGVATRDHFVLYAFAERGDFDVFKPPIGNLDAATVRAYFDALPGKLESIPTRRWTKTEGVLLIEP